MNVSSILFTDTVTVFHWTGTAYSRAVLKGVQWRERAKDIADASGIVTYTHTVSVTVPVETAATVTADPRTAQDVIVYGNVASAPTPSTMPEFLASNPRAVVVTEVIDNTYRPQLKHHRIIGTRGA